MSRVRIRPATAADLDAVRALLGQAALPTRDLAESGVQFWIAEDGSQPVGAIGLERHGSEGLLRSLVVAPQWRGRGLGIELVQTLEREAQSAGVDRLVLLTQTARPFFERLGYAVIARSSAPATVQASAEFRSICPSSATCMVKLLPIRTGAAAHG